jgi:hypothetical protein
MLRAVISQHWVGEVAFEQLGTPTLPIPQQHADLGDAVLATMSLQQA